MKLLLTDRFCERAKPKQGDAQTDYFDETVSGLALRVAAGRKTRTLHFTSPQDGKRARMTLGTYPATSLGAARTRALQAHTEVEEGRDPRAGAIDNTLKAICEEYFRRDGKNLRSKDWREKALARLVYPTFGERQIGDIKRSELVRLLDTIEDESGPVMADRTLAIVRKIMNWHAARSDQFRSPIVRGMARTKPKERTRERTLSDDELRAVWKAANAEGPFPALVKFLLLTAARRTEAAAMTRTEINGSDWELPAERNKTKLDLIRPLSATAQAVLAALSQSGYIFTTDGLTPLSGYSKFKRAFDKACGVSDWTLHDLRRTARTLMSRAGVPSDHAERCLGHVMAGVEARMIGMSSMRRSG